MGLRKEELLPCLGIDLGQRSLSMTRPLSVSQSVKEKDRPFGRSGARQDEGVTALKPVLKQQVRMQTLASVWRNREWQYLFKTCLSGGMGEQNKTKKSWVYQRLGWKKLERPNSVSASAVQTVGSRWFPGLSGSWVTSLPGQYGHALGRNSHHFLSIERIRTAHLRS